MGRYKVQVKVEVIEIADDAEEHDVRENEDGSFSMTIGKQEGESIDKCERALLATAHPTIRRAIAKHLSELSKKNP
jgi:hypothetical protein